MSKKSTSEKKQTAAVDKNLQQHVQDSVDAYFVHMDGHAPKELYDLFMQQIEKPFLETVLKHTQGNKSYAAKILGITPVTLRSRLKKYNLSVDTNLFKGKKR